MILGNPLVKFSPESSGILSSIFRGSFCRLSPGSSRILSPILADFRGSSQLWLELDNCRQTTENIHRLICSLWWRNGTNRLFDFCYQLICPVRVIWDMMTGAIPRRFHESGGRVHSNVLFADREHNGRLLFPRFVTLLLLELRLVLDFRVWRCTPVRHMSFSIIRGILFLKINHILKWVTFREKSRGLVYPAHDGIVMFASIAASLWVWPHWLEVVETVFCIRLYRRPSIRRSWN